MNKTLSNKREVVLSGSEGMTIMELMIVMVIASIMAIAMYKVFETSANMATRQNVNIDAQEGLRSALNFMGKDLSMAGLAISAMTGEPGIVLADTNAIRFWADRNVNGIRDTNNFGDVDHPEILEYRLVGNQLVVIPNPPLDGTIPATLDNMIVILENVEDFALQYIDTNGVRLTPPLRDSAGSADRTALAAIRAVEISLVSLPARTARTGSDTATSGNTKHKLTMLKYIRCRNLGIWL